MPTIIAIALGGALGAVMRHLMNNGITSVFGAGFPWGIFIINILGSFFMGMFIALFAHLGNPSQAYKAFIMVGALGAFTTFSTFSMEVVNLVERGSFGHAFFYITGSVSLSIAGLVCGMILVRALVS